MYVVSGGKGPAVSAEPVDLAALLAVDPDSSVPPYEQVRAGVMTLIANGDLLAGERIPTVRRLAEDLNLAPNTVARSYRELESSGVIETRGRHGSYIKATRDTAIDRAQIATIAHVAAMRELGMDNDTIVLLVTRATRST